jgi:hypothetical protein
VIRATETIKSTTEGINESMLCSNIKVKSKSSWHPTTVGPNLSSASSVQRYDEFIVMVIVKHQHPSENNKITVCTALDTAKGYILLIESCAGLSVFRHCFMVPYELSNRRCQKSVLNALPSGYIAFSADSTE